MVNARTLLVALLIAAPAWGQHGVTLGEAMTMANGGRITDQAKAEFDVALRADPKRTIVDLYGLLATSERQAEAGARQMGRAYEDSGTRSNLVRPAMAGNAIGRRESGRQ